MSRHYQTRNCCGAWWCRIMRWPRLCNCLALIDKVYRNTISFWCWWFPDRGTGYAEPGQIAGHPSATTRVAHHLGYDSHDLLVSIYKFGVTPMLFHAKTNVLNILKIKLIQPKAGAGSNRVPIQQAILVPRFQPNQIILTTAINSGGAANKPSTDKLPATTNSW